MPVESGVRARAREAVTCALADLALDMFDAQGYDAVTVGDIALAADISTRSFFRYFPNKDDVVFGSRMPTADAVVEAYLSHAGDGGVWNALRLTFRGASVEMEKSADAWKQIMRIISSSAELRAKNLERHDAWAVALLPHVESATGGPRRRADAAINTALTCFDVALRTWCQGDGDETLAEIIDDVFAHVRIDGC